MKICSVALLIVLSGLLVTDPAAQQFRMMTAEAGLSSVEKANGVAVADYDGDGDLDVYFVAYPQYDPAQQDTWNRLFRNNGDGTFAEVTAQAGVESRLTGMPRAQMGNKFGAAWGDYDNDGDPDLFLTQIGPDILYQNQGDGTFADVSAQANVAGSGTNHDTSALWWDYDHDGDLDLYISAWVGPNRLYENLGDGTFADVTAASNLGDTGQTWTSIPLDANRDGLLDLYVVNDFGANRFFRNEGEGVFSDATAAYGLGDEGHGMGVTVGDFNNDGLFDIYLTNDSDFFLNPLYVGTEQGPFYEDAQAMGVSDADWAWGTEFFDYDHDGDADLYAVNGFPTDPGTNYLFANMLAEHDQAVFEDRSVVSGTNGERDARGLAVFDYDGDSKLDLLVANWDGPPYLYRNETDAQGWLMIDLAGTVSNRNAFGATVRVTAGGRTIHRHHDGADFLGQSVKPLHVGLGAAEVVERIVVQWPSGLEEIVEGIAVNQRIRLVEGRGIATATEAPPADRPGFALRGNAPNPFRDATTVSFQLAEAGAVEVAVFDLLGRRIRTLADGFLSAGTHRVAFEASGLPSGLYVIRFSAGGFVETQPMMRVR